MFLIFKKYVDKIKFVWIFQVSVVNIEIKSIFTLKATNLLLIIQIQVCPKSKLKKLILR